MTRKQTNDYISCNWNDPLNIWENLLDFANKGESGTVITAIKSKARANQELMGMLVAWAEARMKLSEYESENTNDMAKKWSDLFDSEEFHRTRLLEKMKEILDEVDQG